MTDNDIIVDNFAGGAPATDTELPDALKALCFRGLDARYYIYEYRSAHEPLHKVDVTCHVEIILRAFTDQARAKT